MSRIDCFALSIKIHFGFWLFFFSNLGIVFWAGPLSSGSLSGIGSGLGMPAVSSDPFGQRKMSTPGLNAPTFQHCRLKICKQWWW